MADPSETRKRNALHATAQIHPSSWRHTDIATSAPPSASTPAHYRSHFSAMAPPDTEVDESEFPLCRRMGVNFYSSTTCLSSRRRLLHWCRQATTRLTEVHLATLSLLPSFHLMLPNASKIFICFKIIVCVVSHWAVGAHDQIYAESSVSWPAGEALTGALGAWNPEFNGDLSDHFGSDSAKRVLTVILLSLAVAVCFSLPGCLPSVLPQASGLPLLPGPPGTPVSPATPACARVQSDPGTWPLSHRIHWYFSRAPSGQDPHRQTPQGALDRSRSFLASQNFGIPAVFIPRLVLTVRSGTSTVLKSLVELPCSNLGSPARSSPIHSFGTLFSPRDPVDALDRILFASASWVRCNLASIPGASRVGMS